MQILRPISPIAWIPVAIIFFGIGDRAAIFLIFLGAFFPIVVACVNGVANVPSTFRRAGRNFGLSPAQLLAKVVFPAAVPQIIVGLRLALGIAWLVVVAAEMVAVDSGLGYLVIELANAGKRYDLVVAGMLMIGVIGLVLDLRFRRLESSNRFDGGFAVSVRSTASCYAASDGWGRFCLRALLNVDWSAVLNDYRLRRRAKLQLRSFPSLAISRVRSPIISPGLRYRRHLHAALFQGFPEIKEALISNKMQAGFMVAPLAIALRHRACRSRSFTSVIVTAVRSWFERTDLSRRSPICGGVRSRSRVAFRTSVCWFSPLLCKGGE